MLLGACATAPQTAALLNNSDGQTSAELAAFESTPFELIGVPFFPQQDYYCGPAALATVLGWSGVDADEGANPAALAESVYIPGRRGSLQLEMMAATRNHGRIPYPIKPNIGSLITEVRAGNPVLVLQNLGPAWLPRWHYAVVVGVDLEGRRLILRSGNSPRRMTQLRNFERTWRRADYWAFVVAPPGKLPATVDKSTWINSALALEQTGLTQTAINAYASGLKRWPQDPDLWFGLGNSYYQSADLDAAYKAFLQATVVAPDYGPGFNNLGQVLADLGEFDQAITAAQQAIALGGELLPSYQATLADIQHRSRDFSMLETQ